jgi:hypothetical protein
MQKLALFLLLAVTASMIFTFDATVFAQETPAAPEEDTMEEEAMEDTMEEEAMEDTMEEEAMEDVDSPLEQMVSGVDPHEIQCKSGQTLVFKASNWRPACVNESSFDILVLRGWVASHDPSHEDLTKMQDDYMAAHPQEMEEETEEEVEEEVEEQTEETLEEEAEGETQPQNYTANLSEKINVSAL